MVIAVVVIVGYGVQRVRGASHDLSNPPETSTIPVTIVQINPKSITYELYGSLGGGGKVVYANLNSEPIEVRLTQLPWSYSETTMSPAASLSLVAQIDGGSLGCRILVNGEVRDEQSVTHANAAVACTVTAA